jgi:hypothetical protein
MWATLGGFVTLALALLNVFTTKKDVKDDKRRDLATVEANETDAAMRAIDRQLDGVQPPARHE